MDFLPPSSTTSQDAATHQIIQNTIEANKTHQYVLTKHAQRLNAELAELDKLLAAAAVEDKDDISVVSGTVLIPGSKNSSGLIPSSELLKESSPFFEEASRRSRYINATTHRQAKTKDFSVLQAAVANEHKRLRAIEAQRLGQGIPSASEPVDFDKDVDNLNWVLVAEKVSDASSVPRGPDECRVRWLGDRHPRVNHDPWKPTELDKLMEIVTSEEAKGPINWVQVSRLLGTNRLPLDCMRNAIPRARHVFDAESDARLSEGVDLYGIDNWAIVARFVSEDATPPQCQARYARMTKKLGSWTEDEDSRLALAISGYGPSWTDIATAVPGRSSDQCRERWADIEAGSNALANAKWTAEQDEKLAGAVQRKGKKWTDISKDLGLGYNAKQCRQRYTKLEKRIEQGGPLESPSTEGLFTLAGQYLAGSIPAPDMRTNSQSQQTTETDASSASSSLPPPTKRVKPRPKRKLLESDNENEQGADVQRVVVPAAQTSTSSTNLRRSGRSRAQKAESANDVQMVVE